VKAPSSMMAVSKDPHFADIELSFHHLPVSQVPGRSICPTTASGLDTHQAFCSIRLKHPA
jgi:hypothetical protein